MLELSVVIPAFNEERRLPKTLRAVHSYLRDRGIEFEIIVVNDGSNDGTAALVNEFIQMAPEVRLLSYDDNRGKGYAVRMGVLAALAGLVLFNDADGSSPIEEVEKLEQALCNGYDVAIGSRAKADASRKVEALPHRKLFGGCFNLIVQTLLLKGLQDTQCGFKLFTRRSVQTVFSVARADGFAFDVEVLHIARRNGYKIQEVPINWADVDGSKVNLMLDSSKMFFDVLKIFGRSILGMYAGQSRYKRSVVAESATAKDLSAERVAH